MGKHNKESPKPKARKKRHETDLALERQENHAAATEKMKEEHSEENVVNKGQKSRSKNLEYPQTDTDPPPDALNPQTLPTDDLKRSPRKKSNETSSFSKKASKPAEDMNTLKLNSDFAQKYETRKRREILSSLAPETLEELDQDSDHSDDSLDEEEDEYGELLTKNIDNQIRKTIIALQSKDPAIYKKETTFFEGSRNDIDDPEEIETNSASDSDSDSGASSGDEPVAGWDTIAKAAENAAPKLTIKDYVRETLLQKGELPDSDDERGRRRRHVEEENEYVARNKTILKEDARDSDQKSASSSEDGDSDDDAENEKDGDKADADSSAAEGDGDFFIKKEKTKEELEQEEKDFSTFTKRLASKGRNQSSKELLHSYLDRDTQDEKDRFLRDFVLSNGWLEKDAGPAPGPNDYTVNIPGVGDNEDGEDGEDDEDEDFDEKVDEFEAKYNFRFEEPDGVQVASHARQITDSLRRPDDRRKRAREARKQRMDKEKLVKSEEIKHLKNLKKKEVQSRLLALQEAAGTGMDFSGIDLDADFDPDEFSKQMETKFGEEYYKQEDKELKPLKKQNAIVSEHRPEVAEVIKKSNDANAADEHELHTAVDRLMDEYYNLDYEDIVGGVPVRFKYKEVEPESFGMTAEEVLAEDEKELNRRASLKYLAPYRDRKEVKARAKTARWRAKMEKRSRSQKNRKDEEDPKTQRLKKSEITEVGVEQTTGGDNHHAGEGTERKKKKKRKAESLDQSSNGTNATGDGAVDSKGKKKRRRGGKTYYVDAEDPETEVGSSQTLSAKEQKREMKKQAAIQRLSAKRLAAYNIS